MAACLADETQLGVLGEIVFGIDGVASFRDRSAPVHEQRPKGLITPIASLSGQPDRLSNPSFVDVGHCHDLQATRK
jgi:hypothetical protein